jgi:hypothetical protein
MRNESLIANANIRKDSKLSKFRLKLKDKKNQDLDKAKSATDALKSKYSSGPPNEKNGVEMDDSKDAEN